LSSIAGVDGCFIKLTTGQQILAATGRDGNNNIFPIAFGVVDKEDHASWMWFLTQLKYCIGDSGKHGNYTFISDRQKVLCSHFVVFFAVLFAGKLSNILGDMHIDIVAHLPGFA
jgi:hypothetical protein